MHIDFRLHGDVSLVRYDKGLQTAWIRAPKVPLLSPFCRADAGAARCGRGPVFTRRVIPWMRALISGERIREMHGRVPCWS